MFIRRTNPILNNIRNYSATNLAREPEIVVKNVAKTTSSEIGENIAKNLESSSPSPSTSSSSFKAFNRIVNSKYVQNSTNHIVTFAKGPIRSNLLISVELLKLIVSEQKLLPDWSKWPEAKATCTNFLLRIRSAWLTRGFSAEAFKKWADELTWAHLGRFLRVSAELAAFYYIGQAFGYLLSIPFK